MRVLAILLVSVGLMSQQAAVAGPAAQALGDCLKDNTSGKDRKELARWIFLAMSAHPEIGSVSSATPEVRDNADKIMGATITRLITENCPKQTRAAIQQEGAAGMHSAFSALGQVAMMELMGNPDVAASMGGYMKYLDTKKLDAIISKP